MNNEQFKPGGRAAWMVLVVLTLLNILNYMDRTVISVAMEAIKLDMGFNDTQMGAIQGVFLLGVGLLILPAGIMIDKWSRSRAVSVMAVLWSCATVATGMCTSYISMLVARFGTSAGEAGFQPGGTAWLSVVFDKKVRSKVNGVFMMGSALGSLLGFMVAGMLITRTGNWRIPFYVFGIPGIILGVIAIFLKDARATQKKESGKNTLKGVGDLFRKKSFIANSLSLGAWAMMAQTILAWNVVLLMRAYHLNEEKAGMLLGILLVPAVLVPIISGIIADKLQKKIGYGRPLVAAVGCLLATLGILLQVLTAGSVPYPVFIFFLAISNITLGAPNAIFQVINMDIFPLHKRGTAASMSGLFVFLIFGWWGSILVGGISDMLGGGLYGIKMALLVTVPFGILGTLASCWTCKHYPKESAEQELADLETTEPTKLQ